MTTLLKPQQSEKDPIQTIPEFARIVLVPVANPDTAADLLHLAGALAHPDEGRIIALIVSTGDAEGKAEAVEKLEAIIDEIKGEGYKITLQTEDASTIARGILDAASQSGADLLILGMHQPVRGQVVLGTVVENVLETAPCDVLLYRRGQKSEFSRVVVPVDNTFTSQVAARTGIRLAKSYKTKVEAMHVQGSGRSQYEGLAKIEEVLIGIQGREAVKRTLITAQNTVEAVLARTDENDLIIVGFSERNEFERWMYGDISNNLLNRAEGAVVMIARSEGQDGVANRALRRFIGWIRPVLTRVEQDDIVRQSADLASFNIDYTVLIFVSAVIASLGLLLNSAAVIIGAMLVAPLMSPLIAFSVSLTVGRVRVAVRALITVITGFLMAIFLAVVLGVVLPTNTPTAEMLARGTPTLLDAGVAFAAGMIGAYATARKDIPAALAGVAIAAALMPPICTVGLGIAFGQPVLAFGAFLLFTTNIICIILAGMIVFAWMGMNLRRYPDMPRWIQFAVLGVFLTVAFGVGVQLVELTGRTNRESDLRERLTQALEANDAQLTEFDVEWASQNSDMDVTHIFATVRSVRDLQRQDMLEIEQEIATVLGETVQLELVIQPVVLLSVEPVEETPVAEESSETTPEATAVAQ